MASTIERREVTIALAGVSRPVQIKRQVFAHEFGTIFNPWFAIWSVVVFCEFPYGKKLHRKAAPLVIERDGVYTFSDAQAIYGSRGSAKPVAWDSPPEPCRDCGGQGCFAGYPDQGDTRDCERCGGTGKEPTNV